MNSNSELIERAVLLVVILILALTVYSWLGPKVQEVFQQALVVRS